MAKRKLYDLVKPLSIRLVRKGCANRPIYTIVAVKTDDECTSEGIEQLGIFDPMPNENNERLLALNIDRFKHYVADGAWVRTSLAMLLGTAGVWPLHPHGLTIAWRERQKLQSAQGESSKSDVPT